MQNGRDLLLLFLARVLVMLSFYNNHIIIIVMVMVMLLMLMMMVMGNHTMIDIFILYVYKQQYWHMLI